MSFLGVRKDLVLADIVSLLPQSILQSWSGRKMHSRYREVTLRAGANILGLHANGDSWRAHRQPLPLYFHTLCWQHDRLLSTAAHNHKREKQSIAVFSLRFTDSAPKRRTLVPVVIVQLLCVIPTCD